MVMNIGGVPLPNPGSGPPKPFSVIIVAGILGLLLLAPTMWLLSSCGAFDDSPKPKTTPTSSVSATASHH